MCMRIRNSFHGLKINGDEEGEEEMPAEFLVVM